MLSTLLKVQNMYSKALNSFMRETSLVSYQFGLLLDTFNALVSSYEAMKCNNPMEATFVIFWILAWWYCYILGSDIDI